MGEYEDRVVFTDKLLQSLNAGLLVLFDHKSNAFSYVIIVDENSLLGLEMTYQLFISHTVGKCSATSSPCIALLKYSFSPLRNYHIGLTCIPSSRSHDENGATGEDSRNANHSNQKRLSVHDNSKNVKVETAEFPHFDFQKTRIVSLLVCTCMSEKENQ